MMKLGGFLMLLSVLTLCTASAESLERKRQNFDINFLAPQTERDLVLTLSEPLRFMHKRSSENNDCLLLSLTQTNDEPGYLSLISKNGFTKHPAFGFARPDTKAVVLMMNGLLPFDIAGEQLCAIESTPIDTGTVIAPFNDIRDLARQQIIEAKAKATDANIYLTTIRQLLQKSPLLVSSIISLFGTAGVLYWIHKFPRRKRSKPVRAVSSFVPQQNGANAILAQAQLILQEKSRSVARTMPFEGVITEWADSTVTLARQMKRGQGEVRLARKFEEGSRQNMWEKKLPHLDTLRAGSEPVTAAQKLGVGRGELELGLALRRMQEAHIRKDSRHD